MAGPVWGSGGSKLPGQSSGVAVGSSIGADTKEGTAVSVIEASKDAEMALAKEPSMELALMEAAVEEMDASLDAEVSPTGAEIATQRKQLSDEQRRLRRQKSARKRANRRAKAAALNATAEGNEPPKGGELERSVADVAPVVGVAENSDSIAPKLSGAVAEVNNPSKDGELERSAATTPASFPSEAVLQKRLKAKMKRKRQRERKRVDNLSGQLEETSLEDENVQNPQTATATSSTPGGASSDRVANLG